MVWHNWESGLEFAFQGRPGAAAFLRGVVADMAEAGAGGLSLVEDDITLEVKSPPA